MKFSAVVHSMRLRTLPLSSGGVTLGILLTVSEWKVDVWCALLVLLTALSLQVLSNLCNELGDALRGTDTPSREGPTYSLLSGGLSVSQMKVCIVCAAAVCAALGLAMTWRAFGTWWGMTPLLVLMLGAAAMMAAVRYTLGSNPYGYRGWGDVYVFLFFGLVSVVGSCFVCSGGGWLHWKLLLPASSVGLFSVAVLNVNNIRDMASDAATRTTVAMRLGERGARIYQTLLIVLGWACMLCHTLLCWQSPERYAYVLSLPLFVLHLRGVWSRTGRDLDPMLPLLTLSTLLFCLLAGGGACLYLLVAGLS